MKPKKKVKNILKVMTSKQELGPLEVIEEEMKITFGTVRNSEPAN